MEATVPRISSKARRIVERLRLLFGHQHCCMPDPVNSSLKNSFICGRTNTSAPDRLREYLLSCCGQFRGLTWRRDNPDASVLPRIFCAAVLYAKHTFHPGKIVPVNFSVTQRKEHQEEMRPSDALRVHIRQRLCTANRESLWAVNVKYVIHLDSENLNT